MTFVPATISHGTLAFQYTDSQTQKLTKQTKIPPKKEITEKQAPPQILVP